MSFESVCLWVGLCNKKTTRREGGGTYRSVRCHFLACNADGNLVGVIGVK